MKNSKRILICLGCFVLLIASWTAAISAQSAAEKQLSLIEQAQSLIDDEIFILAVPLLEQAASYNSEHTFEAEEILKKTYLALIDQRGFHRRYVNLLEKQMNRKEPRPEAFIEAANYQLSISRLPSALAILRAGIEKTGCDVLSTIYEENRYEYELSRSVYDYASLIHDSVSQVRLDGLWGLSGADGILLIPCEYDKISTFSVDRAVAMHGGEIFAVSANNNRIAKLHEKAADFGNLAENRIPLHIDGHWQRASGDFLLGSVRYEHIGMYSEGYAPAKHDGKWGVVDIAANWLLPAEYDRIIQDELGRAYSRGAVFAAMGNSVFLYVNGLRLDAVYEDAHPFSAGGIAAVMRGGKWGFIDLDGSVVIDFTYEDAFSFGQHLAAVKCGDHWGYINLSGQMVIPPVFLEAKSFSEGSAPVLTERGWQFITLIEYKRGMGLSI